MKLDAIHHVAIIVSDYQRSREFYVDFDNLSIRGIAKFRLNCHVNISEEWVTSARLRYTESRCMKFIDVEISCGDFRNFYMRET